MRSVAYVMVAVAGSSGIWPETNSSDPARTAWEYGPIAAGADDVETASRMWSGGLDDLAGPQAARADPQPLDSAVHQGANALEVRLEAARRDVVRVADVAADDRPFSADLAAFCHDSMSLERPLHHQTWRRARAPATFPKAAPPARRVAAAQTSDYTPEPFRGPTA